MPQEGPQTCVIRPKKLVETSSNVPYCKAVCIRDGAPNFGRAPKISLERVRPGKWRETIVYGKACAPASTGPKFRPKWCPTSRSLCGHPGYMKFEETERNFLGLKTGSSRVLRGAKCPKKVPRHAP